MKRWIFIPFLIVSLCMPAFCAGAPAPGFKTILPTKDGMLALADRYIKDVSPKMSQEGKSAVDQVLYKLNSQRNVPTFMAAAVEELVNHCTIALTNTRGIEAVIVTSAHLVKIAPGNVRTANLFGVTLHAIGKDAEAILVLEYARTLAPDNELVMLNIANICLDMDKDDRAKEMIHKVIARNGNNRSAYSALAAYWYKKGDMKKTLEALTKASALGGYVVQKKAGSNAKISEENAASGDDSIETIEQKLAKTNSLTPNTTAELIEERFPGPAAQIRDRYGKLLENERMKMPPLPQVNTTGAANWNTKSVAYVGEWQKAFMSHTEDAMYEVAHLQAGINKSDSKAVKKQKGKAAAGVEIGKQFADAEKAIRMMEGMGNIPQAKLREAASKLEKAKAKSKARLAAKGVDATPPPETPGEITSDADAEKIGADDVPPGFDYGSVFAVTNYTDYSRIRNSYEIYFTKYSKWFNGMAQDILKVYREKLVEEKALHEENMKRIDDEEERLREANGGSLPDDAAEKLLLKRKREILRFKKTVNHLSDDSFSQWVSFAFPQYHHRMKPKLDEFWRVCGLYIRNMNQRDVMKREYIRCKQAFWTFGSWAVGGMNAGKFTYYPETDEEERELEQLELQAKADAEAKKEEYKNQTSTADGAFEKWIEDTFSLGVAGEFLSLKISPRKLVVEEYIAGMNFKHVYDFKTGEWTTYRSFCAKIDIGISVGPLKLGVNARADFLESYDTYNVRNGQLVNSGSSFAKGSANIAASDPNVEISHGVNVVLDPAAESELSAKFTHSMSVKGNLDDSLNSGSWSVEAP